MSPTFISSPSRIPRRGGAREAGGGVKGVATAAHDPSGPSGHFPSGAGEEKRLPTDLVLDLQRRHGDAPPAEVLSVALRDVFPGRIAAVSSFGIDSAVLLHLIAAIDPATPILFVDTGRHFAETLDYRCRLTAHLGLTGVRSVGPTADEVARRDADSSRAVWDPDGCCAFRKIAPLERALGSFDAWITGRKRFQASSRHDLPVFERDGAHVKVNPLASWSAADIAAYVATHRLPPHPLAAQGYLSIGCAPCTSIVAPGEDSRAGRWRGFEKTECGIHRPTNLPTNPIGK
jgi:phosphoadenosine phosphosulfate reductase